jgi:GT2 family glycosyltransferase
MDSAPDFHPVTEVNPRCIGPAAFWMPLHMSESAWHEHGPFAFWLTRAMQPESFVELGTHTGFSYLTFCQAVQSLQLQTSCYAIDTWIGDDHAGFYGEDVFSTLSTLNERNYAGFSRLIRSRFDDALRYFPDTSIDLLHIDGRHAYEDVRHDYETWLSKLSGRGVVLFHDTNVRERDFGVWKLWSELAGEYPSFEFHHGHGLGVLAPGLIVPEGLTELFNSNPQQRSGIRGAYARLGATVHMRYQLDVAQERNSALGHELSTAALAANAASEAAAKAAAEVAAARWQAAASQAEAESAKAERTEAVAAAGAVTGAALAEQAQLQAAAARAEQQRAALVAEVEWAREHMAGAAAAVAENARLGTASREVQARHAAALAERDAVLNSTLWRATRPIRNLGAAMPMPVRRTTRRILRASHWILTGQFTHRMEEWRAVRAAVPAAEPVTGPARAAAPVAEPAAETEYDRWVRECDPLTDADRRKIRNHIGAMEVRPLFSVIMPAYNTPENLLHDAIASVRAQLYSDWELCIADDGSPSGHVARTLQQAAAEDQRIKWVRRERNGNIAAATNSALALATGEFVVLMDHDDLMAERALYEVAAELSLYPDADILYSDEDQIDSTGRRTSPYFKPDWNVELMLGHNMVSHLGAYRRNLVERIGGMRVGYEGSQDYDLTLRAAAATDTKRIRHIPSILYHWRQHTTSFSKAREQACIDAARRAVADFLVSQGVAGATVGPAPAVPTWSRVRWPLPDPAPKVSVIIPTRDRPALLARCTSGVLLRTDYPNLEVIIADNDTADPEAASMLRRLAEHPRVRVLHCPGPFNFAAINNSAVQAATGEVLLLLNNDTDVIHGDWLQEMVSLACRPGIGAVGAKLRYPNDTIQHAGVVLGVGSFSGGPGVAGHYGLSLRAADVGYLGHQALAREAAAVTAACLAIRKSAYQEVGGLDEINLPVAFNDVDLCLRLRELGLRNIWTPFAELYHLESVSRGDDLDFDKVDRFNRSAAYMRDRWGPILDNDPFYNTNFSRIDHNFRLAFPARRERPWLKVSQSGAANAQQV